MGQAAYISKNQNNGKVHPIGFYVSVPGTCILVIFRGSNEI